MYGWGGADDDDPPAPMSTAALMTAPVAPPQQQQQQQQQGQWGQEETKELIRIRGDFERESASSPRSKTLWDAVSAEMLRRGFARSPDQCKCKWKNLLNRYKGKETSDPADGRQIQCPFFDELHALFAERAKNMQRQLLETNKGGSPRLSTKKTKRSNLGPPSSDEFSENEEDKDDTEEEAPLTRGSARKRKASSKAAAAASSGMSGFHELLEEFFQQQIRLEKQLVETMERRARERALFEEEWRQSVERFERERLSAERAWKEREEQRRAREESRAERRDALLTTLLNSLINDHNV